MEFDVIETEKKLVNLMSNFWGENYNIEKSMGTLIMLKWEKA